jgi:hypothetical protein
MTDRACGTNGNGIGTYRVLRQDLIERGNLKNLSIDNIKTEIQEAWTGLIWLRIGTGGRLS